MDKNGHEHFDEARKLAVREYNRSISSGEIGYLPSLEGILKDTEIVAQVDLGLIEIPLKKTIGTYTHLRSLSFARNFMPLIETEFREKWSSLCEAHLHEGIRDAIKVYEYMNWFYVIEGNKRVSVLKYFDAYSISAKVTRLIPKLDENSKDSRLYYEFLKFNKITNLYSIWFSKEGSFDKLLKLFDNFNPENSYFDNKYKYFEVYIYNTFRKIYLSYGGDRLKITTGDAFLEYAKIYGMPKKANEEKLTLRMKEFLKELEVLSKDEGIDLSTELLEVSPNKMINTLTSLVIPKKKLKVAFAYARTIEGSGWTYSHELGRLHLEKVLGDQITTGYIENVPENSDAYKMLKILANAGNDIIFTTSPIYLNSTLKCALEFPQVRFFNCSEAHPYTHVSNYYGRTYEPRFLTGIIAGSMTKDNIIGYVATSPTPEVISSINAFALGAKMVNPYAKVKVAYTNEWNSRLKFTDAGSRLIKEGADIICNRTLEVSHPVSTDFGVYSMLCTIDKERGVPDKYLATPIWNWGIFYERILKNILNNTFKTIVDMFSNNPKLINFWWGIDTGVVDIFYSKELVPPETQKLVNLMKKMIMNNAYHPFTGPIYDRDGNLRINNEETASFEQILSMDWFVENVESI
ncbi:BMP family ABC transporter substrate-binding protein [Clostridium sp. YIM B02515]|uniref:BMP family ABC transporter substrate-binding protein n=1 Tax=Clostridium rhizosphaerae TaxID=2803861 RepID=A0ABS1TFM7_9CLOT|nr:BMP family ABC transporter substrate-binding protein [Clostridium rhizosphaerae]MBL4936773.1 BMP family ABC transporter substrate-binding protein [Clostridium rhizosphaerae]